MWRRSLLLLSAVAAIGWAAFSIVTWQPGTPPPGAIAEPKPVSAAAPPAVATTRLVASGLVNFDLRYVEADPIPGFAGAIVPVSGGLLIARRTDGVLLYLDHATGLLRPVPALLPPLNLELIPERFDGDRAIRPSDMRYNDIEIVEIDGTKQLLVTYNQYDPAGVCFRLRLDAATLPPDWEPDDEMTASPSWRKVLATEPCLAPSDERNTFGGNQAGGRLAVAADGSVLLSTGDYEFDGLGRKTPAVSQLEGSDYGRVLRIDLASGEVTEVSRGHRNPQGLTLDADGRIWLVEHGPMGGDELNLVEPGTNYGWPSVTLGVHYVDRDSDTKTWPGNPRQGRHDLFAAPAYAWMPSVAPSSLVDGSAVHRRWKGDLLVGTLAGRALRRLRLDGDRVLYDEEIPLDGRVRDLAVDDGRIHVLFDDGRLATLTAHPMTDINDSLSAPGSALRDFGCAECHSNPRVPRLAGVLGADIASQPGLDYSAALSRLEGEWTRERLGDFLRSPQAFAPGTTMPETGLPPGDIESVLAELERLRR